MQERAAPDECVAHLEALLAPGERLLEPRGRMDPAGRATLSLQVRHLTLREETLDERRTEHMMHRL